MLIFKNLLKTKCFKSPSMWMLGYVWSCWEVTFIFLLYSLEKLQFVAETCTMSKTWWSFFLDSITDWSSNWGITDGRVSGMEWKLKWDYKLGIKYIRRFAERENRGKCFKGDCWARFRVCFFKIFRLIGRLFCNSILWDEIVLLYALILP